MAQKRTVPSTTETASAKRMMVIAFLALYLRENYITGVFVQLVLNGRKNTLSLRQQKYKLSESVKTGEATALVRTLLNSFLLIRIVIVPLDKDYLTDLGDAFLTLYMVLMLFISV